MEKDNVFGLAAGAGLGLAGTDRPRDHGEVAAWLPATRARALDVAAHWLGEVEAGRGYGSWTLEYIRDHLALVAAIDALRVPQGA